MHTSHKKSREVPVVLQLEEQWHASRRRQHGHHGVGWDDDVRDMDGSWNGAVVAAWNVPLSWIHPPATSS